VPTVKVLVANVAVYGVPVKSVWLASGVIVKTILLMLPLKPEAVALTVIFVPTPNVDPVAGELMVTVRAAKALFTKRIIPVNTQKNRSSFFEIVSDSFIRALENYSDKMLPCAC